jgi:glycosyltransferase involved in cell wall biosynthesis
VEVRSLITPGNGLHHFSISPAVDAITADPPDWLVLQYNPFSYGRYGWASGVVREMKRLRKQCPSLQIAVMAHESFVDVADFRQNPAFVVMTLWQRWQFWQIGQFSDVVFLSTEPRAERFSSWFPDTKVYHLPVGSNIPFISTNARQARSTFGLPPDTLVAGLFGTAHVTRLLPAVRAAMLQIQHFYPNSSLLYVGPDGDTIREVFRGLPLIDAGKLPAHEVSQAFQAMDLYLAPFERGVSTRRGSFLTGLQHGIPTVSTLGSDTGPTLRSHSGQAYILSENDEPTAFGQTVRNLLRRQRCDDQFFPRDIGSRGKIVYDETFDWTVISKRLRAVLAESTRGPLASTLSSNAPRPIPR